jgi:SAM-dependent methyltransferase
MLDIAQRENPKLDLRLGSGYKIPFKEKFDIVQASLVLEHIKDWDRVFKEVYRVLKKSGIFVFSTGNPVISGSKGIKIEGNRYNIVHDYFSERILYNSWKINRGTDDEYDEKVENYHKTYETIIRTILKNKFMIVDYRDAVPIKKAKKLFPDRYYAYKKIPTFCIWKVRKIGH